MQDNGVSAVGNGKSLVKRHKLRGSGKSATGTGENRRRVPNRSHPHPSSCMIASDLRESGRLERWE
jgi:hypothetical protein